MKEFSINKFLPDKNVQEILEALISFGDLNFEHKAPIKGESDQLDALAAGINMLGEELHARIVKINEREIMLREIHHRVKNNLQIVSSILNLQASGVSDQKIIDKFMDCKSRISSIALVHEQLYQSENLSELEVNSYFAALCDRLEKIYCSTNISVEFISIGKSFFLPMDMIVPLGLIANELILNSFKHSFDPDSGGKIRIELKLTSDTFTLKLSDDGIGFKNEEEFYNSKTLGLQLVHSLIDQLNAKLDFSSRNPYFVSIALKV